MLRSKPGTSFRVYSSEITNKYPHATPESTEYPQHQYYRKVRANENVNFASMLISSMGINRFVLLAQVGREQIVRRFSFSN